MMELAPLSQPKLPSVEATLRIGEASLTVRGLWLREGLGLPYTCELVVYTQDHSLRARDLFEQDAALEFGRLGYAIDPKFDGRTIHGVVQRVRDHGIRDDIRQLHVTIEPALALLRHRVNTRIFTHRTVPEILDEVLAVFEAFGRGRPTFTELRKRYEPRDVCVQYAESDLDFVHRLMGEEGICYRFVPSDDGATEHMVLCDVPATYYVEHRLLRLSHGDGDEETLSDLDHDYSARSVQRRVSAFNWRTPDTLDVGIHNEETHLPFEIFEHEGRRQVTDTSDNGPYAPAGETQSDRRAELYAERQRYETTAWALTGNVTSLEAGSMFEVSAPQDEIRDGLRLCLTELQHVANFPDVERHAPDRSMYECRGRATLVPFVRDYGVPRPRIAGPQTATVVGPEGEEIWVDEWGRIKVRFHWERLVAPDGSDGWWVRVKQMWAGPGWGSFFVPRIGMEVVVEFLDGNPDCPLVTGCVYNGNNAPPYPLPDSKTKSTLRSESSPGGGGFNELRFEDAKGSEELFIHAQRNLTEVVKASRSSSVGGGRTATVGGDDATTVSKSQTLTVKEDRTKTVTGTETRSVTGARKTDLGADDTLATVGKTTQMLDGGLEVIVASNAKYTVSDKHELTVTGEQVVSVTGKSKHDVVGTHDAMATTRYAMSQGELAKVVLEAGQSASWGNASATMAAGPAPAASVACTADGRVVIEAMAEIILKCGDTTIILAADGTISIGGPQKVTLAGGGTSTLDLSASGAELSAPAVKAAANGTMEIQGANVKIN